MRYFVNEFAVDWNSVYVNNRIGIAVRSYYFSLFHMITKDKAG
jgi:hypothetical protein